MKSATRLRARRAQAAGAALALASALYAFRGGARQAMKFTRFAEAGDEDEEDEDEVDKDIRLKLEGVVIIVSGMILLSIGFEQGREVLFHRTSESMRPILTSMFSELTTLGFISVTLFVIFTIPWMETLSESIYGEEEGSELDELSETVHMVLFLVMVLFLAQAIGLVALGNSIQKQWRLWETSSINKLPRSIVGYVEDISRRPFAVNLFTHRLPVPYRILVYKATRDTFVRNHLAKTPDFDFSAYLSACLGHTIAEIVEIPMNTWLFFELLLILCWVAFFNLTQDWGLVMWLVIGYFTGPILAAVLHAKIRGIVQMHCANDIREILKAKDKKQIAVYGATGHHHGLEENYHLNFWCGSSTKSAFTLDMIRVVCLAQAIYVAVAVTTYVPQAFAASCGPAMAEFLCLDPLWVKCTFLVIMFLPPIIVITKMPRILEDFTVASNIDTMVHHRILSNVQRRSKTVAAFEALKVVQCLSDTTTLRAVLAGEMGEGSAGNVSKEFKERMAERNRKLAQLSASGRKQLEARQKRHWHHVFDIFDDDNSGFITTDEFRELVQKFGQTNDTSVIEILIKHLDEDGSGQIEFNEFLEFGIALEAFTESMADKEEMKAGMYRLVDKDDSGTITLAELFKLLNEDLGIHVSMDDVYNIVADLDEDGNGELDEEEFAVMLDRLHVYDTSTLDEVIADESTGEGLDANTGVTLFESVFGVSSMFGRDRSDTGGSDDSGQGSLAEHLLDPRAC
jgi:Ca2+-binding EF-hand superfamily protein